jgi:hypothetical protein
MGKHWVPQELLRGFSPPDRPGHVWMFDRQTGQWSCPVISKAAQQKDYYSPEAETWITTVIEGPGHRALNRIRAGEELSADERAALALYMAAMHGRVPKTHQRQLENAPELLDETVGRLRADLIEVFAESDPVLLDRQLAELERVRTEYHRELPTDLVQDIRTPRPSIEQVTILASMTWRVLTAPPGMFFVTSDDPLFFFPSYGIGNPESETTFPVSSTVAIVGSHQGPEGATIAITPRATLVRVTRRTISAADRFIYSPRRANWIETVAEKRRPRLSRIAWTD